MKALIFTLILFFLCLTLSPQGSYSTGVPGTMPPGNQAQPPELSPGTIAPLQPPTNQNGINSATVPAYPNVYPNTTYPPTSPPNPASPGVGSPTTPSPSTFPTNPGNPGPNQLVDRLYQSDPMRSPKAPKQTDPVTTVDGSTGKHKNLHHTVPAKKNGFVSNRRTKGVKSRVSREKSSKSSTH